MTATHTTSRARIAELAATCVHCGFCLSACPTYAVTRAEADSPRGRIWLLAEEATRSGPVVADRVRLHIDRCIGCEACVPACPSGVRYDEIIHLARGLVEPGRPLADRTWRRSLARLFPSARASAAALALGRPLFALRPALARVGSDDALRARSTRAVSPIDATVGNLASRPRPDRLVDASCCSLDASPRLRSGPRTTTR